MTIRLLSTNLYDINMIKFGDPWYTLSIFKGITSMDAILINIIYKKIFFYWNYKDKRIKHGYKYANI